MEFEIELCTNEHVIAEIYELLLRIEMEEEQVKVT